MEWLAYCWIAYSLAEGHDRPGDSIGVWTEVSSCSCGFEKAWGSKITDRRLLGESIAGSSKTLRSRFLWPVPQPSTGCVRTPRRRLVARKPRGPGPLPAGAASRTGAETIE